MGGSRAQKADYFEKLRGLLTEYKSLFIVGYNPPTQPATSMYMNSDFQG